MLFDAYGIDNCKIELLEKFPCKTKEELNKREGEVIRSADCVNRMMAGRTQKQWRLDNKATIQERAKKHYETNCEREKARAKDWRKNNLEKLQQDIQCPCGGHHKYEHANHHSKTRMHLQYLANLQNEFNARN